MPGRRARSPTDSPAGGERPPCPCHDLLARPHADTIHPIGARLHAGDVGGARDVVLGRPRPLARAKRGLEPLVADRRRLLHEPELEGALDDPQALDEVVRALEVQAGECPSEAVTVVERHDVRPGHADARFGKAGVGDRLAKRRAQIEARADIRHKRRNRRAVEARAVKEDGRATYGQEHGQDPVSGAAVMDKLFKLDLRLMW